MDIHMSGCIFPAQFDKETLINKIEMKIKRCVDLYVQAPNRKNPVPGPKVQLMLDKFGIPFIVLELDTTELGLRLTNSEDYINRTLFAITLNKNATDVLIAGSLVGSVSDSEAKREIIDIEVKDNDKQGCYQNLGIGKVLVLMFEKLAEEARPDIEYTTLDAILDEDGKNINFYKKLGFYPITSPKNNLLFMAKGVQKGVSTSTQFESSGYYRLKTAINSNSYLDRLTTSDKIFWNSIIRKLQSYADAQFEGRIKLFAKIYGLKSTPSSKL